MKARCIVLEYKGLRITRPLYVPAGEPWLCNNDFQDLLPIGECWYVDGQWLINPADVQSLTRDDTRTSGCCGPHGMEPNYFAPGGEPLGIGFHDCCGPHSVSFAANLVSAVELGDFEVFTIAGFCTDRSRELVVGRTTGPEVDFAELREYCIQRLAWEVKDPSRHAEDLETLSFKDVTFERPNLIQKDGSAFLFLKFELPSTLQ